MSRIILACLLLVTIVIVVFSVEQSEKKNWGDMQFAELSLIKNESGENETSLYLGSREKWTQFSSNNVAVAHYVVSSSQNETTVELDYLQPPNYWKNFVSIFNLPSLAVNSNNYTAAITIPNIQSETVIIIKNGEKKAKIGFEDQLGQLIPQLVEGGDWLPMTISVEGSPITSAKSATTYHFEAVGSVLVDIKSRIQSFDSTSSDFSTIENTGTYQFLNYRSKIPKSLICSKMKEEFTVDELIKYKFTSVDRETRNTKGIVTGSQQSNICFNETM